MALVRTAPASKDAPGALWRVSMPVLAQDLALASPTMSSLNEGQLRRARGRHGIMAIRNCATARRSAGREAGKAPDWEQAGPNRNHRTTVRGVRRPGVELSRRGRGLVIVSVGGIDN